MARQLLISGFYEGCAFHSQQAAEKAVLGTYGHSEGTHSCVVLLQTIESTSIASVPPDLLNTARRIDMHYVEPRYLNAVGGPPHIFYDETIAEEVLQWAERLKEFGRSLLL